MSMKRYKISVLTLAGARLTFTVSSYNVTDGNFISFIDEVTGRNLNFHASRCEIEVVSQ